MTQSKKLVYHSLLIGILYIVITFIAVPTSLGYINIGDSLMMLLACVLPLKSAIIICAMGAGLADITFGYYQYFIFTLIIKSVLVIIVNKLKVNNVIKFSIASIVAMILYGIADCILFSSLSYFTVSVGFNSIQAIASVIIALLLQPCLKDVLNYLKKQFI